MDFTVIEEKKWSLVEAALTLPRPLSTALAVLGMLVLAGYFGSIEVLYRPIAAGPATHPLTAVSVVLLSLAAGQNVQTRGGLRLARLLIFPVVGIVALRLGDRLFGTDFLSNVTPFQEKVASDLRLGRSNSMGLNTAFMLAGFAAALSLYGSKKPGYSQLAASVAGAVPQVSLIGYAYGLTGFYGQMAIPTAAAGTGLAAAVLALTANEAALKAILSPYIGGTLARAQVLTGCLVSIGLGYVFVVSLAKDPVQGQELFGVFVVAIVWFIVMMISASAIFHERMDCERRQSEARLAALAQSDPLTGLPNRRKFLDSAQYELERIKRTGSTLWVMMIDIDYFKRINDNAGHAVGDRVLLAVADLLAQSIRKIDLVGRIGGEEFAVVLIDTNREGCERVAENIRASVEALQVPEWTELHGAISVSIGCTELSGASTLGIALQTADRALYQSKQKGRNRVSFG